MAMRVARAVGEGHHVRETAPRPAERAESLYLYLHQLLAVLCVQVIHIGSRVRKRRLHMEP
jgi:hypothetical protein